MMVSGSKRPSSAWTPRPLPRQSLCSFCSSFRCLVHCLFNFGLFNLDFIIHCFSYLLNYPRWRRCTGSYPNGIAVCQTEKIKLLRTLNKLNLGADFLTDLGKMQTVCTVLPANDDHSVAALCKFRRFILPRKRSKTYCIKYLDVCTSFF